MDTTKKTYKIPAANLDNLKARIDKLNRKAAKLGVAHITMTVGEAQLYNRETGKPVAPGEEARTMIRIFPVTIEGVAPTFSGWTFAATVQHVSEVGNILRVVPGMTVPEVYRTAAPSCDHCKVDRHRKDTFVVQGQDGSYKQVGRQCLGDFLGGQDPHNAAAVAELLMSAGSAGDEYEGWGGGEFLLNLKEFLAEVASVIEKDGWLSRSAAEIAGKGATADFAYGLMLPPKTEEDRKNQREYCPTDKHKEVAEKTLEFIHTELAEKDPSRRSDYEHNLLVVCSTEAIGYRSIGLAASAVAYVNKIETRRIERARVAANSQYFGEVGKRAEFTLTCMKIISLEGNYGVTHLHRMVDENGNLGVWFASESAATMEEGETFKVKATVKKHEDYQGVRQTVLSRCKILEKVERKAA